VLRLAFHTTSFHGAKVSYQNWGINPSSCSAGSPASFRPVRWLPI
jgi:hypothetical protein